MPFEERLPAALTPPKPIAEMTPRELVEFTGEIARRHARQPSRETTLLKETTSRQASADARRKPPVRTEAEAAALTEKHQRFAFYMVNDFHRANPDVPLAELESQALLDLYNAARTYDEKSGAFTTHAGRRIHSRLVIAATRWRKQTHPSIDGKMTSAREQTRAFEEGWREKQYDPPDPENLEDKAVTRVVSQEIIRNLIDWHKYQGYAHISARNVLAFMLTTYHGLSLRKTGKLLGVSGKAVKTINKRTIEMLRNA